ncbi:hypothetical protein sos41_15410 [Alphaproteobacteria bacterium SO-S41]|nr:hypothetical protein sos41_15410 [Alphaproteobacteria bacterium SO-S41]
MGLESHIHQLSEKHRRLEETIADELAHPGHDELKIVAMKRQKLRIKEELERLRFETTH